MAGLVIDLAVVWAMLAPPLGVLLGRSIAQADKEAAPSSSPEGRWTVAVTQRAGRPPQLNKGARRLDSNRIVDGAIQSVDFSEELLAEVWWDELDRSRVPGWIETVRQSEQQLRRLRQRLEAL